MGQSQSQMFAVVRDDDVRHRWAVKLKVMGNRGSLDLRADLAKLPSIRMVELKDFIKQHYRIGCEVRLHYMGTPETPFPDEMPLTDITDGADHGNWHTIYVIGMQDDDEPAGEDGSPMEIHDITGMIHTFGIDNTVEYLSLAPLVARVNADAEAASAPEPTIMNDGEHTMPPKADLLVHTAPAEAL